MLVVVHNVLKIYFSILFSRFVMVINLLAGKPARLEGGTEDSFSFVELQKFGFNSMKVRNMEVDSLPSYFHTFFNTLI